VVRISWRRSFARGCAGNDVRGLVLIGDGEEQKRRDSLSSLHTSRSSDLTSFIPSEDLSFWLMRSDCSIMLAIRSVSFLTCSTPLSSSDTVDSLTLNSSFKSDNFYHMSASENHMWNAYLKQLPVPLHSFQSPHFETPKPYLYLGFAWR